MSIRILFSHRAKIVGREKREKKRKENSGKGKKRGALFFFHFFLVFSRSVTIGKKKKHKPVRGRLPRLDSRSHLGAQPKRAAPCACDALTNEFVFRLAREQRASERAGRSASCCHADAKQICLIRFLSRPRIFEAVFLCVPCHG